VIAFYGDIKPSMLQDFERGRKTEIDFINGYVVALGHASGMLVHMNATITDLVHQIERGVLQPTRERMNELADQTGERTNSDRLSHFVHRMSLFLRTLVLRGILSSERD
jgi:Ketopantoate reductase PanE/ApbA C terminal